MGSVLHPSRMKIFLLIALSGAALAAAAPEPFLMFARDFTKSYKSTQEMRLRREIFNKNHEKMIEHNKRYDAGEETWWMKVHEDMDLTDEERMDKYTGGIPSIDNTTELIDTLDESIVEQLNNLGDNPRSFDWRSKGMVSSVKSQGQCGSCAAFSVMGAVESCFGIENDDMVDDLSEQHIIDCAYKHFVNDDQGSWGAYGCDGAWPVAYLDWLANGERNQIEKKYPYTSGRTGVHSRCNPKNGGYPFKSRVTGFYNKWYPKELDMENVVQINPVSSTVQVTNHWGSYGGGVLNDNSCCNAASDSSCVRKLNHAILVVGYGFDTQSGLHYWIIKNSWGGWWGDEGYLKLKKGSGHCGVGSMVQAIPKCKN